MALLQQSQSKLGSAGLSCSRLGIGCMGMTAFYGDFDRALQEGESLKAIETALKVGINFFDTAWIYQSFGKGGGWYKEYHLFLDFAFL